MDRCLPHGKMKKINVVEVWFMIFSNCVSFPGVAMLKLGGSSSRRQRNSAWQSCCHIMTGTAKKQFLILSWLHARLEQICPQVSFACNIGTFGFVALCLSTFGFQCDSVLLTFGIHWPFSIFGVSTFTCLVDAVQFVFLWFVFLDVKDSTRSWSRGVLVAQHGYLKIRQVKHMWKSRRKNQQFSLPFDLQAWNFFDQLLVGSKSFDPCLSTCCLDETNCSISNL